MNTEPVTLHDVQAFWQAHPLCAAAIPFPPGTPEFFRAYDRLREANESVEFSYRLHEYKSFAGKKVLDVGCGNGYVLSRYAREGADVFGIDLTQAGVDLCEKRFAMEGLNGRFTLASAEAMPFEDESFDCVCSMGVLHHTPDTPKAVKEILRVMKRGGRLIVMVYHRNSALYRIIFPFYRLMLGRTLQQQVNEVDGKGNPKGDVYSRRQLARLLSGFERLEMFAGHLNPSMLLPGFLGKWVPAVAARVLERRLGWFLYAKGWKPAL